MLHKVSPIVNEVLRYLSKIGSSTAKNLRFLLGGITLIQNIEHFLNPKPMNLYITEL